MRSKFAVSAMFVILLAVVVGLGYQVRSLRQELADVRQEIQVLKQQRVGTVFIDQPATPNEKGPFRLLNTESVVHPSIENGMKADEWRFRQRMEHQLKSDDLEIPRSERGGKGFEEPFNK